MNPGKQKKSSGRRTPRPVTGAGRTRKQPGTGAKPPSIEWGEFLARAWALEVEAAERYAMFADAMEEHNNREVAELFRKLARIEQMHADQLLEENLSHRPPSAPAGGFRWDGGEGPETAGFDELHYRMQPYHALQIALASEKRANLFFAGFAASGDARVRKAAGEMAEEEAEHVRLIEDWLTRTPPPDGDWERDPDPPVVSD